MFDNFSIAFFFNKGYNLPNCLVLDIGMVIKNLHHPSKFCCPMHPRKHNYSYSIRIKVGNCSNTVEIFVSYVKNSSSRVTSHFQPRIKDNCHIPKLLIV